MPQSRGLQIFLQVAWVPIKALQANRSSVWMSAFTLLRRKCMLERRKLLGGGAVLLVAGVAGQASGKNDGERGMPMPMPMKDCIDLCWASHLMCLETAAGLTVTGSSATALQLAAMLSDCAEICQTTANSMIRRSPLHTVLCQACAEVCERCARACGQQGSNPSLARCVESCRSCSESCRHMATMG